MIRLVLFCVMSFGFAQDRHEASALFQAGKYPEALEVYQKVFEKGNPTPELLYDLGTANYKAGKFSEALPHLKRAALEGDSLLRPKSWYNLGNTQFKMGLNAPQPPEKIKVWKEAIVAYKEALSENPKLDKARRNLEFAQAKLKEAIDQQKQNQEQNKDKQDQKQPEPSPEAQKAFAKAMRLLAQGLYQDALRVLTEIVEQDDTAQNFQSHLQRLQDVVDIHEGRRPTREIDHSNLDNELGVI